MKFMPLFTLMHLYTPILPCKTKIASFIYKKKEKIPVDGVMFVV